MTTPLEALQRQMDDLNNRLRLIEAAERPNQALDTASDPTFNSLFLGGQTHAVLKMVDVGSVAGGGGLAQIAVGAEDFAIIFVMNDTSGNVAGYALQGGVHATQEIFDPSGAYTITKGTATSINIYWSAGNARYEVENTNVGARVLRVFEFMES